MMPRFLSTLTTVRRTHCRANWQFALLGAVALLLTGCWPMPALPSATPQRTRSAATPRPVVTPRLTDGEVPTPASTRPGTRKLFVEPDDGAEPVLEVIRDARRSVDVVVYLLTERSVIDALVAAGIPKEQMKTTGYSIYPVYQDSTGLLNPKITTYRVANTLQVILKDVNQTGNVIDTAVTAGVNTVNSIQFMLSDEQAQTLRTEALKKAVTLARADADVVAAALGVNITGTQSADISQGYMPVVYDTYRAEAAITKSAVPTPIQPGDITVTAQVTITYSIR